MKPNELRPYFNNGAMPALGKTLEVVRGTELMPQRQAFELTQRLYAKDELAFPIGTLLFPHQAKFNHVMFMGNTGYGKSVLMLQMLKDSLAHAAKHGHRHFIWAFKPEWRQFLEPYDIGCPVNYINPLSEHGVGIDIARDVGTSPHAAEQLARDMISPKAKDGEAANNDWVKAARAVFSEVIKIFMKQAPGNWRLIDVLEACLTEENLKRVLSMSRIGQALLSGVLGTDKQAAGVLFTLQGAVLEMWPLASAMAHSRNISLKEWAAGGGSVLVLEHNEEYAAALAGFERWVFGRVVDFSLTAANEEGKTTQFWLDEVRHGPFDSHLMKLATVGRGRGIGIVMGLTDISGLSDQLNPHQAEEVLGSFSTQVFLGQNNPHTAAWVSERLGSCQAMIAEASMSETRSPEGAEAKYKEALHSYLYPQHDPSMLNRVTTVNTGKSFASPEEIERYERHRSIPGNFNKDRPAQASDGVTISLKEVERPVATKYEVMSLPRAEVVPRHGLMVTAYVVSPYLGRPTLMVASEMNHPDVTLIPASPKELPNVERPAEHLDFPGWTDEDVARLKLPPLPEKRPARTRPTQTRTKKRTR